MTLHHTDICQLK